MPARKSSAYSASHLPFYRDVFFLNFLVEGPTGLGGLLLSPLFLFSNSDSSLSATQAHLAAGHLVVAAMLSMAATSLVASFARDGDVGKSAVAVGALLYHLLASVYSPVAFPIVGSSIFATFGYDVRHLADPAVYVGLAVHLSMALLFALYLKNNLPSRQ